VPPRDSDGILNSLRFSILFTRLARLDAPRQPPAHLP
jgi:hypothetical protein